VTGAVTGAAGGPAAGAWTTDEMMTVAAARELAGSRSCFVGIGLPSTAANLARRIHSPGIALVYESGTIGARPTRLPLSIGDGELAETAAAVVSVAEIFNYWLQPGRIDVGMLGGAQIDRYGNLNSTVVGDYERPAVRLPGAGGAPEIAGACPRVLVVMRQSPRAFVERVHFVTTVGYGSGPGTRRRLGLRGGGPHAVVTDLGVLRPDPAGAELTLTEIHPGRTVAEARDATGWPLAVAGEVAESPPPTGEELAVLRSLRSAGGAAPAPGGRWGA
jgi:glutaconate CoA-transferase subunit B